MAKVSLKNLCKRYIKEGPLIVDHVDLEIHDGEFLVLVGPSGCGKSTLLRMVAGLEKITDGEIYIGDKLVNKLQPKDRNVSMEFQNYALYPNMTVSQNIGFGMKIQKKSKQEIRDRVEHIAGILELTELLDKKPGTLSGGQRQRVALGRAIARKTDVLLMDEPLSNLDAKLRVQTRSEILKLHKRVMRTTIYVTHDQVEAMTMGDRIAILNEGIIQQVDTPERVFKNPANLFVAGFLGAPAMNFISGIIEKRSDTLFVVNNYMAIKLPPHLNTEKISQKEGSPIFLGIRPEHVKCIPISEIETFAENDEVILEGKIAMVESLGAEDIITFNYGDSEIIVRTESRESLQSRNKNGLVFDKDELVLFDEKTTLNLSQNAN